MPDGGQGGAPRPPTRVPELPASGPRLPLALRARRCVAAPTGGSPPASAPPGMGLGHGEQGSLASSHACAHTHTHVLRPRPSEPPHIPPRGPMGN